MASMALGRGRAVRWRKREVLDAFAAGGDAGFAVDAAAVFESGDERDVGDCGGENLAADREDFAADADGFGEIAGDVSERGEEEIAEIVADEAAAGVEAILEEAAEKSFVLAESDHAVADVAGRKDAIFAAQAAGAAAVVGDGDDGGEAGDGMLGFDFVAAAGDEILEAAQQRGKAGAAAEGDDVESVGERFDLRAGFFNAQYARVPRCDFATTAIVERLHNAPTRVRYQLARAFFFRVEHFGEARIFLKEGEVFVVARVIAIFGAQIDRDFEIFHGGVGFAGEAIERGQRVMNVVGFGCGFAGFVEAFARVVPTADVHHGDAALVVLVDGLGIRLVARLHALLGDFEVHASAIGEFFAGAFENFFELAFGFGEFLLMKEGQGFVVELQLSLNTRVDHLDAAALGGMRWS